MGLDMYTFSVNKDNLNTEFSIAEKVEKTEIFYWRKNNALHGWMKDLYVSKGGDMQNEFNCDYLRLTKEDLLKLQMDILLGHVKNREGFFWGSAEGYYDPEYGYFKEDLKFIGMALGEIVKGNEVYYVSWW